MVEPRTPRLQTRTSSSSWSARLRAPWSRRGRASPGSAGDRRRVQGECFDDLDAAVIRATAEDGPCYAKTLEKVYLPQPEKVIDAVKRVLYREEAIGRAVSKVVLAELFRRWRRARSSSGTRRKAT